MEHDSLSARLALGLGRLGEALRILAWHEADRRGLSTTQTAIVDYLVSHAGESSPSTLAGALGVRMATISDSLAALQSKGLITRQRSRQDARRVTVSLTAQGRRSLRTPKREPGVLARVTQSLDRDEQQALLRAVMKAIRILQDERQISPAAMCVNCTFFEPYRYANAAKPHHCRFVNAPFGDAQLQVDCPDFALEVPEVRAVTWKRFLRKA